MVGISSRTLTDRLWANFKSQDEERFRRRLEDVQKLVDVISEISECGDPGCSECIDLINDAVELVG